MTGTDFSPAPTPTAGAATDDSAGPSPEARLADRTRDLDELTRQHAATVEILDIIARSPAGLQPVLDAVVGAAVRHCGADDATMFLREGSEVFGAAHEGPLPSGFGNRRPIGGSPLDALIIRDGQTIHAPDTEALDPVEFASVIAVARRRGVRALVGAPIRNAGEVIGFLLLRRREVGPFSARQIATLETLATQAGVAVANAAVITELRQSLDQQTATAEVLQVINASPGDTTPVFETILQKTHALCGIAYGSLQLYDGQKFRAVATHNLPEPLAMRLREGYVPGANLRQLIDGAAFAHFPDIGLIDEPMAKAAADGGMKTLLCVPLRTDGRLLGQIVCVRMEVRPFTDREIALLQGFAAQAVIAMENARLISETRESLEQQTATADILRVISQSPTDVGPVLRAVVSAALRFCGAEDAMVALRDGDESVTAAHEGPLGGVVGTRARLDPRGRGTVRAIVERRTIHVPDVAAPDQQEFAVSRALGSEQNFRAFIVTPLMRNGVAIGSIGLRRPNPGPFTPRQIALLESFAAQAVIAIENVRLFNETREALERQTAMAEVLTVINASPGNLTPVFDTILDKALSLSRSSLGFMVRFDGEKFWQVAWRNVPPAVRDLGLGGHVPEAGTQLHRLVLGDDVSFLADITDEEAYRAGVPSRVVMADEAGARSLLTVALRKDGRLLGGIQVYRTEVRAFSEAEVTLVRSFADQAVIAMENARLLTETKEALEQQTATAEVLRVINASPGDLEPVFEAILAKAHDLCGATLGSLNLFDGGMNRAVATRGMDDAFSDFLRRGTPMSGVLSREHSVQIADLADLARQEPDNPVWRAATELGGVRTMLGVPLVKDGNVLGRIVAARQEVRPFTESQIALLENFAAQAVIAMDNARLLEQIRQRQAELRVTFDNMGDGVAMFDAELRLAAWNRNFERIVGVPEDRLADRPSYAQYLLLLAERGEFGTENVEAELAGRLEDTERELRLERTRADGTVIEVRRNAVPGGGFVLIYSDITQRRKAEAAIREARDAAEAALERQTATSEILQIISQSPTDARPVFEAIARSVLRLLNGWSVIVWRYDGERMRIIASHGGVPGTDAASVRAVLGERRPEDLAFAGDAILKRVIQQIADVEAAGVREDLREVARARGWRANIAVPMLRDGAPIGVITVSRKEPGAFVEREMGLLQTFAAQAVIAIENVRLFTELRDSLEDLKAAQANLIQSEKMASLGQLTAGIAHEIKNPLNFVNNFAGLSVELLAEIREVAAPAFAQLDEAKRAEVDETMALITGNLEKIAEHGKRADGIVKSMLSHSRGGTGEWQAVDINALVEEALNLAFHGARAQDKNFNISLERDLTPASKPIEVVPQDVTRVFLNLFGNGFYAANKRRLAGTAGFKPLLRVSTRDLGEVFEIKVRDNGTGIPDEVRAKLFQPFFTTKPTGEGTGLGLSISYDIVTQQHGGTIEVESEVGSFTEFTVRLPRSRRTAPAERTG
ncbi:MAG: GAF domain-containing protein [Reyranella sp.]|nr:GAF domain-containing protein [Reyranella sp.]